MLTRRDFLRAGAAAGAGTLLWPASCGRPEPALQQVWVNDVHSQLNRTRVAGVARPGSLDACRDLLRRARSSGRPVSIAAGRHAMGGQQFGTDTLLIDMNGMNRIVQLDAEAGWVDIEAGVQWPALVEELGHLQAGRPHPWGITQKQTGADRLGVGGALSANAHGRGLTFPPIVADVEAFDLMDATGEVRRCSRAGNRDLFGLAIGGYGLFGLITSVRLRLTPRRKLQRVVEVIDIRDLPALFDRRIADGFLYGDFQYATDRDDLLRRGVFACYRPVADDTPMPPEPMVIGEAGWEELIRLAHTDRRAAFRMYADSYLRSSGQIYWSDEHQLSLYVDDYHARLASGLGASAGGSEMITEIYVPRDRLVDLAEEARRELLGRDILPIYGTIRLVERDDETFLPWARERYACVIFNLHTGRDPSALEVTAGHFRKLIDLAIERGGSYFLTYHRWARRDQVLACYPRMPEFLRLKREHDPDLRFASDWHTHYANMFSDRL